MAWRTGRIVSNFAQRDVAKEPFAWCYRPWLRHAYDVKVIVFIKHPVSQVASNGWAGWRASVTSILGRPALVAQLEASDREALIDPSCSDAIAAARQWRWQCRLLGKWAKRLGWPVVKIEDISEDPHTQFASLYDSICWPIPAKLAPVIARRTGAGNPAEARPGRFQDLNRYSKAIFAMRRASVPVEVRRAIFDETFDVAKDGYDEASYPMDEEAA